MALGGMSARLSKVNNNNSETYTVHIPNNNVLQ